MPDASFSHRLLRGSIGLVLAAAACVASAQSPASTPTPTATTTPTSNRLTRLAEDFIAGTAADDPIAGSALGLTDFDSRLSPPSEAARAERIARLQGWKAELETIARDAGSKETIVEAGDVRLLRANFDARLNELVVRQTDRKDYAGPALRVVEALFSQFLRVPIVGRDGATQADVDKAWDDITSRLEQAPAYIVAGQRLVTKPGRLFATVGSKQLGGAPDFLNDALGITAKTQMAGRPAALARFDAAREATLTTMAETRAFLDANAASWPDNHVIGKAAYEQMLRDEMLLPFDSADLVRIADDELAHGWAEEAWLQALSAKRGIPFGPQSGGGLAPGGPALVGYYRERIAELTAFMKELDVVTVPAWLGQMEIVETPAFLQPVIPGASMRSPRLGA